MQQAHAEEHLSESAITSVFETLGIATQEQRDKIASQAKVQGLGDVPEIHVTWLSTSSEPVPLGETNYAKLEQPSY